MMKMTDDFKRINSSFGYSNPEFHWITYNKFRKFGKEA